MSSPAKKIVRVNGKQRRLVNREQLRFTAHGRQFSPAPLNGAAPVPPASFDQSQGEKLVYPLDGNDQYGDCYYAACCHGSQNYTGNSGTECSFNLAALEARYLKIAGGDNGLDDGDMMPEWKSGIVGPNGPRKIIDELTVDPTDEAACTLAAWAFGGLIWTCSLIPAWVDDAGPGAIWDDVGTADPEYGHAMYLTGKHANGNWDVRTWGISPPIQVTPAGVAAADSEFIVAFSLDQFTAEGICAFTGLSYEAKALLWVQCGGKTPPPSPFPITPAPTPAPTPRPAPTPAPTGADVLTIGTSLPAGNYPLGNSLLVVPHGGLPTGSYAIKAHHAQAIASVIAAIPFAQILAWITQYGLPAVLQVVSLIPPSGFQGMSVAQIIALVAQMLTSLQPVPAK